MIIYHQHHIIPQHAGGTDDPSNLVYLTIAEHAEAHKILYEQYGRKEDKLAWLGLSGQIGLDEIIAERNRLNNEKRLKNGTHPFIQKIQCPECGKVVNTKRRHFENCTYKLQHRLREEFTKSGLKRKQFYKLHTEINQATLKTWLKWL